MGISLPLAPGWPLRSATAKILLGVVLCAAVSLARVVSPADSSVGAACRLPSGSRGECRLVTDCPSAVAAVRRTGQRGSPNTQHQRCGFKGTVEIVCCDRGTDSGGTGNRPQGGVRHNPGDRDPGVGNRRPWLPGGGGRPYQDGQSSPGGGGRPRQNNQSPGGGGRPRQNSQSPGGGGRPRQNNQSPGGGGRPRQNNQSPGGGGRPHQDSQWLPGANRGAQRPTAPQRVERKAAAACRVYTRKCPNNVSPYIIDGTVAGLGEIPHMAALGYNSNDMGESMIKWDCGGTLISDRYVMTAAHCTRMVDGAPVVVRLGDQDLAREDEGASPVDFTIDKIEIHPSYSSNASYHDIALLRLGRSVNFTEFICPACLYLGGDSSVSNRNKFDVSNRMTQADGEGTISSSFHENTSDTASDYELGNRLLWDGEEVGPRLNNEDDLRDKNLIISGWGATSFPAGDRSPVLMLAKIEPFSFNECNTSLYEANGRSIPLIPRGPLIDLQICAGDKNGKQDTCLGDSGGPLQYKGKESSSLQTVVGVTSFGIKCGFRGVPGVYTRVSAYVDWIEQKVWPQGPPS